MLLFSIDKSVLKNYYTLVKERMNGGIIMRLWKKALSLVLVSAMAFSMCACGGKKDEGSKKTDTFKIGGIGPTLSLIHI